MKKIRTRARDVVLFGGSFDPPHFAHVLAVAQLASGPWDEVWVIPCPEHAFGKDMAPFADRVALCRAAFGFMRKVRVLTIENRLPRPARTLNTLIALKKRHPGTRFTLAFGADVYDERSRWYRFSEIERLAEVVYFRRPGYRNRGPRWVSEVEFGDISSTAIRAALRSGKPAGTWLPAAVIREIRRRGLYRPDVRQKTKKRSH